MRFHQKEPAFKKRNTYGVKAQRNKKVERLLKKYAGITE